MEMKDILELVERIENSSFAEVRIVQGDTKIILRKQTADASSGPAGTVASKGGNTPGRTSGYGRDDTGSADRTVADSPDSDADGQPSTATRIVPGPDSVSAEEVETEIVSSPIVGTFYRAPTPDSPPFVEVGTLVRKGQTLCILEAMKVMNELESEHDCTILEMLVENGTLVEYGTPLYRVTK